MLVEVMSSVASKHSAVLLALGGFSIAALFVWYIRTKKEKEQRKKNALNGVSNQNVSNNISSSLNASSSELNAENASDSEAEKLSDQNSDSEITDTEEQKNCTEVSEEPEVAVESEQQTTAKTESIQSSEQEINSKSLEIEKSGSTNEVSTEADKNQESIEGDKEDVVEVLEKQHIPLTESASPQKLEMPTKKKTFEHEQIPEEPTPTKVLDQPLSLDIDAQMSPAAFSWSEEMEKNSTFNEDDYKNIDSSDMEPASPSHNVLRKIQNRGSRKGRGNTAPQTTSKRPQRKLNNQNKDDTQENNSKRAVVTIPRKQNMNEASGDCAVESQTEVAGYDKSNSPGLDSQNSEASSQDSGRATGGLASSLSPMDENGMNGTHHIHSGTIQSFNYSGHSDDEFLPMYEFEIPNSLVGLIIGVKGKTIKELSLRTNVRMLIRQHHSSEKVKTHQICQVRGKRDEINQCLQMLRRRFPSPRFPELNLQPVVPPLLPNNNFDMLSTQPTWLTLTERIPCEIAISSIITPSHFFIQQPTHGTFASLRHLDMYMLSLYGEHSNLPELPVPCQNGLLCAAPVGNAWFRAVTVHYYEETDEVFVKFVDYGGYSKMARQDLRQIRTDLMTLPFQSTEVMLANVRPVDGTVNWSQDAMNEFTQMCTGKVITCELVGHSVDTKIPLVELTIPMKDYNGQSYEIRFDKYLMEKGYARTSDPSKMIRAEGSTGLVSIKRPSLASQTSQTTVVC